jgi:tRNA uridine 5-carboxymethylaminomethyl modification enzyme
MFTSRAEYRLLLNHGSAELRLAAHARRHGLLSSSRLERIEAKRQRILDWIGRLESMRSEGVSFATALRRDRSAALPPALMVESREVREEVIYRVVYQGYLEREVRQINKLSHAEQMRIPKDINYLTIKGLRKECALKLTEIRPSTVGQAGRVSGVNPADLTVLMVAIAAGRGGS